LGQFEDAVPTGGARSSYPAGALPGTHLFGPDLVFENCENPRDGRRTSTVTECRSAALPRREMKMKYTQPLLGAAALAAAVWAQTDPGWPLRGGRSPAQVRFDVMRWQQRMPVRISDGGWLTKVLRTTICGGSRRIRRHRGSGAAAERRIPFACGCLANIDASRAEIRIWLRPVHRTSYAGHAWPD